MSKFAGPLVIAGVLWLLLCATGMGADAPAAGRSSGMGATETKAATSKDKQTPKDVGSHAKQTKRVKRKSSPYSKWKRTLSFWPRKAYLLAELGLFIIIGVLIAQMLEVSGAVKYLAWVTWPVIKLGRLGDAASPALLMSVQSGAVANGMLVSSRDQGQLNRRQLYSAVLVVSCLSLFAHLPTYVIPIGSVLGPEATIALFSVRFAAIFIEIVAILLVSNLVVYRWTDVRGHRAVTVSGPVGEKADAQTIREDFEKHRKKRGFWSTVWARSWSTVRRLLIYLIPTYAIMAALEYHGAFKWLAAKMPGLFSFDFLPPESTIIIPAQAMSLYTGAIAAANFIDSGDITHKQAVLVILVGSLVTSPVRTLKHAMPTYVAVLGPKAGPVMAITAQVLRSIFLAMCAVVMWFVWT